MLRAQQNQSTTHPEEPVKTASELHADQVAYWGDEGGSHWVDEQERTDRVLAPVTEALFARVNLKPGEAVLDVGCGCGTTTIEIAKRVGPKGRVVGIDVSKPMLTWARERSKGHANADYVLADAASHAFPEPFADLLFSRFGVMFFGDPTATFANLRRALKPAARLLFACWRPIDQNPWVQVPLHAAYEHVERLPKPGPDDPGPMSFANPDRVTRILTGAGFAPPRFAPVDIMVDISGGTGLDDAVHQAMSIGPASRAIAEAPESVRAKVRESIKKALAPHAKPDSVRLGGAIWLVEASAA